MNQKVKTKKHHLLTAGSNQAIALCQALERAYATAACSRVALVGRQPRRSTAPNILSSRATFSVSPVLHTSTMLRQVAKVGSTFSTWDGRRKHQSVFPECWNGEW